MVIIGDLRWTIPDKMEVLTEKPSIFSNWQIVIYQKLVNSGLFSANSGWPAGDFSWCPIHGSLQYLNTGVIKELLGSPQTAVAMFSNTKKRWLNGGTWGHPTGYANGYINDIQNSCKWCKSRFFTGTHSIYIYICMNIYDKYIHDDELQWVYISYISDNWSLMGITLGNG